LTACQVTPSNAGSLTGSRYARKPSSFSLHLGTLMPLRRRKHSAEIASNPASMCGCARCYGRLCPGSGIPLSRRMRLAAREWL
jgi:hypothetical protein